jgi:hypothetical protein
MSDNIQEAEVGSGTKVADTKQSEKRAQLTLKAIQLRMKQEKERAALQQQKKSLSVKEETMTESFSPSQIAALKAEYSKINRIDPSSDTYKKLIAMLDKLDLKSLQSLAGAEIKFVSMLAKNRVMSKSMKKEEVEQIEEDEEMTQKKKEQVVTVKHKDSGKELRIVKTAVADYQKRGYHPVKEEVDSIDELSTNKLADYKKKAGAAASVADKAGDTKTGNKRFSGIMKATRKQFANDANKTNEELDIELAEVLSKDSTAGDWIHDFVRSDNPKFAGKSKEMRKKMALAAYYAKQKNEELSPKQKAMDKNKNGKIDGFDLAKLRGEELSPAQKAIDKNKNNKIDATDLAHLRSKKKLPQGADFAAQRRKERLASSGRMDEEVKVGDKVSFNHPMTAAPGKTMKKVGTVHKVEDDTVHVKVKSKYGVMTHKKSASELTKEEFAIGEESINEKTDYETYHKDYSSAVQTAIKQAEKRGFEVDMNDWDDKVATGPKKPSAGKTNSFSINLMKDGKPSKKKLQMQVYNMDNQKYELNMYIEEVDQDAYVGKSVAESIMDKINAVISGNVNEKTDYEVYHKDYSGAVQTAIKQAEKRGFEVDMDDWHDKVATGPKKPSAGKTNSFSVNLMKDGKPSKKKLQMQVYNMDNQKYELNMYIEEVQLDEALRGDGSTHEGEFQEKGHGNWFTYKKTADAWAKKHGLQHEIEVGDHGGVGGLKSTRFGTVKGTVAHIATGENDDGTPSMEKWPLKKHNKYDKWGARAESVKMTEDEVESIDELNKDTLYSYAKKSEKDQDDQYNKVGKGIRDKDPKSANKAGHKFSMRSIGQNRAEKRLAKEGVVDKIKAIKRGLEARAKASDHFDKAMDTKSPDASKHLKKAVRYHNLLNKEETEIVTEAKKKSFKDVKKKMKEEEMPSKVTIKKGDVLTGKREPIEINPELKEPSR